MERHNRGFATMDQQRQREIASKGGRAAHVSGKAHEFTAEQARTAGRKGGLAVSRDRHHMANIGRKGGQAVSRDRAHMAEIGKKGGTTVSESREHTKIAREGEKDDGDRNRPAEADQEAIVA